MAMSACYFGEIVEPFSRAFLDDSDDEYDENTAVNTEDICKFAVSWKDEKKEIAADNILVFHGAVAEAFARQYLINDSKLVGHVEKTNPKEEGKTKQSGRIYRLSSGILALVTSNVTHTDAVPFIDSICELLTNSEVLIVTSLPVNMFRCPPNTVIGSDEEGFLRSLTTDPPPAPLNLTCLSLEIPNIITGVPAGVLTWCQCHKIKACLLVCYSDESCGLIDSRTLAPLVPLLSSSPLKQLGPFKINNPKSPISHDQAGNMYL